MYSLRPSNKTQAFPGLPKQTQAFTRHVKQREGRQAAVPDHVQAVLTQEGLQHEHERPQSWHGLHVVHREAHGLQAVERA